MAGSILRLPQVKVRTGLSRATIYKYIAAGWFHASCDLDREPSDRSRPISTRGLTSVWQRPGRPACFE
jgi:Prophage CP4-57 regulatory protein (AlpA)